MRNPIAYTYDADTHCPPCAIARFGRHVDVMADARVVERDWPRADARDAEGNPVGAIFPWDEWHEADPGDGVTRYTLACATCGYVVDECVHGEHPQQADECECDACTAGATKAARP